MKYHILHIKKLYQTMTPINGKNGFQIKMILEKKFIIDVNSQDSKLKLNVLRDFIYNILIIRYKNIVHQARTTIFIIQLMV